MMKTPDRGGAWPRGEGSGPRPWGILLDLDQTLVLTSSIEHLRDSRRWREAARSMAQTSLPPGTREFVDRALEAGPVGVVTNSPRSYAEKLLRHHAIELPVLVAYHDVARRKPHPEPLLRAAAEVGVAPEQCVYVGDSDSDILAAIGAGAVPVGITWEGETPARDIRSRARAWCKDWNEVLHILSQLGAGGKAMPG